MARRVGSNSSDVLTGTGGGDTLIGNGGHDVLIGGRGGDILIGGDGNDILIGQSGNDELDGQRGSDILVGGGGKDLFVLAQKAGIDIVMDFTQGQDSILIQGVDKKDIVFVDRYDARQGGVQVDSKGNFYGSVGLFARLYEDQQLHLSDFI